MRRGHQVSPGQYREQFQLPATMPLVADDLREAQAERGRALVETNPRVRAAFAVDDPHFAERSRRQARGVKAKAKTEKRAGVQLSKQAVGAQLGAHSTRRAAALREELDAQARASGYRDLRHLLVDTAHLTHADLGELMGWSAAKARSWRGRYNVVTLSATGRAQHRANRHRTGLAEVPKGTQPADEQGRLRCLECGRWWVDLAQHVAGTHRLRPAQYRNRYELSAEVPLMADSLRQRQSTGQRERIASAVQAGGMSLGHRRSAAARRRYDEAARRHGYADVVDLLSSNAGAAAAVLLGVGSREVPRLRRRYQHAGSPPVT